MAQGTERFVDRAEAGRKLGARLASMALEQPVVYALPRGGVPVALEVARALKAPLDLIFVRKIGAPSAPEVALGAIVDGAAPQMVINEEVMRSFGSDADYLEKARARELVELERSRTRYLGDRPQVSAADRTAVIVDDGLATGATMKAAIIAMRRQGARRICVAVPVAPAEVAREFAALADTVVCLNPAPRFYGVGGFYDDFHQLSDEETVGLLRQAWAEDTEPHQAPSRRNVAVPPLALAGELVVPEDPRGLIIFAHGSGSSRLSPRNRAVAEVLNERGFATLLFDLLTPQEAQDRRNVFDIPLLAERVVEAVGYVAGEPDVADLAIGLFGASTGAGAALVAAANLKGRIGAVVSRGGRPDLAGAHLAQVTAPTLLIVGGHDEHVLTLNRQALFALESEKMLKIVPGASHLFEEPGALEMATEIACNWFEHYLQVLPDTVHPEPERHLQGPAEIVAALRSAVIPLPEPEEPSFAAAFDDYGSARVVLLGEASHGTSEFYRARAAITMRLVERHGFTLVAAEADWPDAAKIDRYIRHRPGASSRRLPFSRFPTWMWRNREVDDFVARLRDHNAKVEPDEQVRFHGLDLYSMTASIAAVLEYLDRVDPAAAREARQRYGCIDPWSQELAAYGRASLSRGYALCEAPVMRTLLDLLQSELLYAARDGDEFFDAVQNARLVANAERYYRVMYYGSHESWNLRDSHMFETLKHVLDRGGPDSKAVVWAHNSHIGDARFTDMGSARGELNIGQLCREEFGRRAVLIGFGTHSGTVAAASEWDAPMEVKTVRPSRPDSYEALCHGVGEKRFLLDMGQDMDPALRRALRDPRLERYIGVIYRPETERWSHYSHATLPDQYDAFVWFDETRAVTPVPTRVIAGEDETYPFGL
ncbi:alpha/beta family hydrolase [Salipiger sp. PrR002]|uniref:alpha/beta family hydrolase n=1 Tax=Salipiger sp. PrR002 TaxID=2706489 RepID=UPI0013BBA998|nr:alpha/beta family hydrolase [Salipiger sp. PrR002]NDW01133.1 erythromycin esterase [Salipiger sp. PrR002]NDW57936.1 erythromycin esterase [Salipiger sp. PrR004]